MVENDRRRFVTASALSLAVLATLAYPQPSKAQDLLGLAGPAHSAPAPAANAAAASAPGLNATLVLERSTASYETHAKTVAAFLAEHGIVPSDVDYVSAPLDAPLSAGQQIRYRAAQPVEILVGAKRRVVLSADATVGDMLRTQQIAIGRGDRVEPAANAPLSAGLQVRVARMISWSHALRERIRQRTKHVYDPSLPLGTSKVAFAGVPGERVLTYEYVQRGDANPTRYIIAKRIVRAPRERVVVHGIGEYAAFARMAVRGFEGTLRLAGNAMRMVATAYTASCSGCSGFAANGQRAGHGIVAVDPRVIPLGTRLYIPGYGRAVAGDTGGAIVGHRIDLGFNSLGDALLFGRRTVTVYLVH